MSNPAIPAKSFMKAMTLPDDQRRKVLEKLGAKMMEQLRTERAPLRQAAMGNKLAAKTT